MNNIPFQCSECPQNRRIDFCPACECKEFYIKGQRHVFRMAERRIARETAQLNMFHQTAQEPRNG